MANGTSIYDFGGQAAGVLSAPRLAAAPGPAPATGAPLNMAVAGVHVPLWLIGVAAGYFLLAGGGGSKVGRTLRLSNPRRRRSRPRAAGPGTYEADYLRYLRGQARGGDRFSARQLAQFRRYRAGAYR